MDSLRRLGMVRGGVIRCRSSALRCFLEGSRSGPKLRLVDVSGYSWRSLDSSLLVDETGLLPRRLAFASCRFPDLSGRIVLDVCTPFCGLSVARLRLTTCFNLFRNIAVCWFHRYPLCCSVVTACEVPQRPHSQGSDCRYRSDRT